MYDVLGFVAQIRYKLQINIVMVSFMDDVTFGRSGPYGDAWLVALRYRDGVWIVLGMESKDFYRASICKGGLCSRNSVCTSVCSSVCLSHAWIVTNLNVHCRYFDTTRKGNHSATRPKSGWWATPPSLWNLRSNWPTPLRKTPTSTGFRS